MYKAIDLGGSYVLYRHRVADPDGKEVAVTETAAMAQKIADALNASEMETPNAAA